MRIRVSSKKQVLCVFARLMHSIIIPRMTTSTMSSKNCNFPCVAAAKDRIKYISRTHATLKVAAKHTHEAAAFPSPHLCDANTVPRSSAERHHSVPNPLLHPRTHPPNSVFTCMAIIHFISPHIILSIHGFVRRCLFIHLKSTEPHLILYPSI